MLIRNVNSLLTSAGGGKPVAQRMAMTLAAIAALAAMVAITVNPASQVDPAHSGHIMGVSDPAVAGRPQTTVRPISCEPLSNVPGKSLTVAVVDYPPDAYTPRHRHPGSVSAFVLKGSLRSQLEGGPPGIYRAGETWFEPPGAVHLFAENISKTEPAALLATFIADGDCGPLVIPD